MTRIQTRVLLLVGAAIVAASCSPVAALSDDELAECTIAANSMGTIGGSATLISTLVLRLPDEAVSAEESPGDDFEARLDAAFREAYGISVDEFLVLRDDADATATAQFGEPPSLGEPVSDEWFVQRDTMLMRLWNQRFPQSARTLCDLLMEEAGQSP